MSTMNGKSQSRHDEVVQSDRLNKKRKREETKKNSKSSKSEFSQFDTDESDEEDEFLFSDDEVPKKKSKKSKKSKKMKKSQNSQKEEDEKLTWMVYETERDNETLEMIADMEGAPSIKVLLKNNVSTYPGLTASSPLILGTTIFIRPRPGFESATSSTSKKNKKKTKIENDDIYIISDDDEIAKSKKTSTSRKKKKKIADDDIYIISDDDDEIEDSKKTSTSRKKKKKDDDEIYVFFGDEADDLNSKTKTNDDEDYVFSDDEDDIEDSDMDIEEIFGSDDKESPMNKKKNIKIRKKKKPVKRTSPRRRTTQKLSSPSTFRRNEENAKKRQRAALLLAKKVRPQKKKVVTTTTSSTLIRPKRRKNVTIKKKAKEIEVPTPSELLEYFTHQMLSRFRCPLEAALYEELPSIPSTFSDCKKYLEVFRPILLTEIQAEMKSQLDRAFFMDKKIYPQRLELAETSLETRMNPFCQYRVLTFNVIRERSLDCFRISDIVVVSAAKISRHFNYNTTQLAKWSHVFGEVMKVNFHRGT